jgi:ectoine hydroxylase
MKLTNEQITSYHENGFLLIESLLEKDEIKILRKETRKVIDVDQPGRILEKNGVDVRSVFAPHKFNDAFDIFCRLGKIVEPVVQLLHDECYVYQAKLNSKSAFDGDHWEWHQDFPFWHFEDNLKRPEILSAMVFVDEISEFNGPMFLVPGSQQAGIAAIDSSAGDLQSESVWFKEYQNRAPYMAHLTSKLKYTIDRDVLSDWMEKNSLYSAKGPAGSVLLFHGNVFHSSPNNLSNLSRNAFFITYNAVKNAPQSASNRPDFLCSKDYRPVTPLPGSLSLQLQAKKEKAVRVNN